MVNKQIRSECLPIYWSKNSFDFYLLERIHAGQEKSSVGPDHGLRTKVRTVAFRTSSYTVDFPPLITLMRRRNAGGTLTSWPSSVLVRLLITLDQDPSDHSKVSGVTVRFDPCGPNIFDTFNEHAHASLHLGQKFETMIRSLDVQSIHDIPSLLAACRRAVFPVCPLCHERTHVTRWDLCFNGHCETIRSNVDARNLRRVKVYDAESLEVARESWRPIALRKRAVEMEEAV